MEPTRHLSIRKYVAVAAALAGLALPATVSAYPVIGEDPSNPAQAQQGRDWMTQRAIRIKNRAHVAKPNTSRSRTRTRICPGKVAGVNCVMP
jgi:hypothetical protein